jgi:hypothetical protein
MFCEGVLNYSHAPAAYAHRSTYMPMYSESHIAQRSDDACVLCNSAEHEYSQYYGCPITLVMT